MTVLLSNNIVVSGPTHKTDSRRSFRCLLEVPSGRLISVRHFEFIPENEIIEGSHGATD